WYPESTELGVVRRRDRHARRRADERGRGQVPEHRDLGQRRPGDDDAAAVLDPGHHVAAAGGASARGASARGTSAAATAARGAAARGASARGAASAGTSAGG